MRYPFGTARNLVLACVIASAMPGTVLAQQPSRIGGFDTRGLDPSIISAFSDVKAVTHPAHDAIMGFSLATNITEVVIKGGQEVTKGQILVRGDDGEDLALLKLQKVRTATDLPVQRAKKQAELAEKEHEIQREVSKNGGSSPQQLDRARLAAEVAVIDFENAKVQQTQEVIQQERMQARVDRYQLKAPFDGVVDQVLMDVGQVAAENEKVIRVVNIDTLWIDAPASTMDPVTMTLKVADKAWVLIDVAGAARVTEGRVVEVAPTADPASRTRRVRVEIDNPKGPMRLLAGEPCYVRFTPPSEEFNKKVADAVKPRG